MRNAVSTSPLCVLVTLIAEVPGRRFGRGGASHAPEVQGEQVRAKRRSYVIALPGVWGRAPKPLLLFLICSLFSLFPLAHRGAVDGEGEDIGLGAGFVNDDTDGLGGDGLGQAKDALVADGSGGGDGLPLLLAVEDGLDVEALDQLPLGDVLLHHHGVEGDGLGGLDLQLPGANATEEVTPKGGAHGPPEGAQVLDIRGVNLAVGHRGDIEQQDGVAADRTIVEAHQLFRGLDLAILLRVVEPTGADRNVALGRIPDPVVGGEHLLERTEGLRLRVNDRLGHRGLLLGHLGDVGALEVVALEVLAHSIVIHRGGGHHAPLALARQARLVAHPAHIRPRDGDDTLGVALADGGIEAVPVILLALTVGPLAAGAIEPNLVDGAIVIEELVELPHKEVVVGRRTIARLVAIPRREVHPHAHPLGLARRHELAADVPPPPAPRRGSHRVLRQLARPKAEAIVMLRREDGQLNPRRLRRADPLPAIERSGVELPGILLAIAPLAASVGIHPKVEEGGQLIALPSHLLRRRPYRGNLGQLRLLGLGQTLRQRRAKSHSRQHHAQRNRQAPTRLHPIHTRDYTTSPNTQQRSFYALVFSESSYSKASTSVRYHHACRKAQRKPALPSRNPRRMK